MGGGSLHNDINMPKIFTIGFSGKSPDAFLDVLNAVRVRTVWDIRLWRASTHVPFYSGDSLSAALGPRYEYHPEFDPSTEILAGYKEAVLPGLIMKECIANYWSPAPRPRELCRTRLTASACSAQRSHPCNATAAWQLNTLYTNFQTSKLSIYNILKSRNSAGFKN